MEEIKIIDVDKDKTHRTPEGLHDVPLILSDAPPAKWQEIFYDIWYRRSTYNLKRPVRFSGKCLIITCGLDEIRRAHLPQLKKVFQKTEAEYQEHLVKEREKEERRRRREGRSKRLWTTCRLMTR